MPGIGTNKNLGTNSSVSERPGTKSLSILHIKSIKEKNPTFLSETFFWNVTMFFRKI